MNCIEFLPFGSYLRPIQKMAKGGTTSVSKTIYFIVETDDPDDEGYAFHDLQEYLEDWNDMMGTDYATVEDFNNGEQYREMYVINLNDVEMARGGQLNKAKGGALADKSDSELQQMLADLRREIDEDIFLIKSFFPRLKAVKAEIARREMGKMEKGGTA